MSLTIVDANGDGKPDLVTASNLNPPYAITTALNNGDGTFAKGIATTINQPILSIAGADLNGDGKADLILAPTCSSPTSMGIVVPIFSQEAAHMFQTGIS